MVSARGATWRVVETTSFPACLLVELDGADPTNHGLRRTLIHPFDRLARLERRGRPRVVTRRRWMNALTALLGNLARHDELVAAASADIELLPYQLEPVLAAIREQSTRLLLADEVGLGKTIQAGLILAELRARRAAARALILTPAGLRDQWAGELAARFHLDAAIVDAGFLRRATFTLPAGVNPWSTVSVALASLDFVKRPEVIRALEPFVWDLLVVDEAHAAAGSSDRGDATRALAARARRVVLLTATPHAGDAMDYRSLCDIGRLDPTDAPILLFRRSRADVGLASTRRVRVLRVRRSTDERRMHDLLDDYTRRAWREGETTDARLALTVLQKRALSSAAALARSLSHRLACLSSDGASGVLQLDLPLGDADPGEADERDAEPTSALAAPAFGDRSNENTMVEAIRAAALRASSRETKLFALDRLLRRSAEPAIVFTEYRDTALLVAGFLAPARPLVVLHGGLSRAERREAELAFTSGRAAILVATDAGSEGLNLQASCRLVVSLELPWNPMRLEQRIGRVERIGQRRTVHAVHLVASATGEERVLARLAARLARAREGVGYVPDMLGPTPSQIAAAVVARVSLDPRVWTARAVAASPGGPTGAVQMPSVSLHAIAEEEAERIRALRPLVRPRRRGRPLVGEIDSCLVSCLPRRRLLRGRHPGGARASPVWSSGGVVWFFRLRLVDEAGHRVDDVLESVFAPMSIATGDNRRRVRDLLGRLGGAFVAAEAFAARLAEERRAAAAAGWEAGLARTHARDQAIARRIARDFGRLARPIQVGLFDRRVERQTAEARRVRTNLVDDLDEARFQSTGALRVSGEPELSLVLLITS